MDILRILPGSQAQQNSPHLQILYVPIDKVQPNPVNPRVHSRKQIRQIAHSIQAFGYNVPILVDGQFRIVVGEGRLEACRLLGIADVPVIQLDHLSDHQIEAFRIADNKLTDNSKWDDRLLAESLKGLSEANLDFDIEVIGFDMGEIDFRIQGLSGETGGQDPADTQVESASGPAVSKVGDLWILGEHRVFCGSALDPASYTLLMEDSKADMVITDSPYNCHIQGHVSGLGTIKHREFAMASGEMTSREFVAFLEKAMRDILANTMPGAVFFAFMDWRHAEEILAAGKAAGCELINLCVWVKDNGGMGSLYRSQHELVFVFKNGTASHQNHIQLGRHGRYRTNVWNYPGINSFARKTEEGNLGALHPTVKPVALVADAILDCSSRGDIILDPFLGSGTGVISAERTGRRCYGMELDPIYVDVIVRRWQSMTGNQARHSESGKTFDDIAKEKSDAL